MIPPCSMLIIRIAHQERRRGQAHRPVLSQ